jgi:acetyl esterase/lipase
MRKLLICSHFTAWIAVVALSVWAWRTPPIADEPDWNALGISRSESIVYRADGARRLRLEVYRPSQTANGRDLARLRPAVLAIHGGSWIAGSMTAFRYDAGKMAVRLAQRGFVVAAIDYQLARPHSPSWPGVIDDLREAVRWLRRHSTEYGIDPDRIAVMGQSSGGHLAAVLGTLPESRGLDGVSSRVQAIIDLYGPSDLAGLMSSRRLTHEPARSLLGDAVSRSSKLTAQASPLEQITADMPPTLLIHGDDDAWVPLDQSVRMAQALDRVGVPNKLIVIPGARHGFETALEVPVKRDLVPEIVDFLERAWKQPIK